MDRKAESVKFVVILSAALILIGFGFIAFGKNPTITAKTTYTQKACYDVYNGKLTPADVVHCCVEIKKSNGCRPYVVENLNDELFICNGDTDVVVDKDTIEFCG